MKRIIICADGTWNKPEENLEKDFPTNVLKFSRAIKPVDSNGVAQTVFYDWGIGSYHNNIKGGAFHLKERAPGVSVEEIKAATAGKLIIEGDIPEMKL